MRKLLHRVAPYARRIRTVAHVAGPALHVLLFLPRPRWADRLILGASAAASLAEWVADAAAGEEGEWRLLPLGLVAPLAAEAVARRGVLLDRRGLCAWYRLGDQPIVVRQRDQREAPEVLARHGSEASALAAVAAAVWGDAGGLLRAVPTADGLRLEPVANRTAGRARECGAATALAEVLWPEVCEAAAPPTAVLAGPRGSRAGALARQAAALRAWHLAGGDAEAAATARVGGVVAVNAVTEAARDARALEVSSDLLLAHAGALRDAAAALRLRLLSVRIGATDFAAPTAEAARAVAGAAPGASVALICTTQADANGVPLGPCDAAVGLAAVGGWEDEPQDAAASLAVEPDDESGAVESLAAAALRAVDPGNVLPLENALAAAAEATAAVRAGLRAVGEDPIREWPAAYAAAALQRVDAGEDPTAAVEAIRDLAEAALDDWETGAEPDPESEADEPSPDGNVVH